MAGAVTVIWVPVWVPMVAAVPPTVTDVTVVKFVPVILRAWVAVDFTLVGVIEVTAGAAT